MIRYSLRCEEAHRFDSWFGSSVDFDRLSSAKLISCAICGSIAVQKDLMAPAVGNGAETASLSTPASPAEQALGALRKRIEAVSENVGRDFAAEARRIHAGDAPERPIIGEARLAEARALIEDGIPVAPLPWSVRKAN